MSISRQELFEIWRQGDNIKGKNADVLAYVLEKCGLSEEDNAYASVKTKVKNLNSNFADKWKKCNRSVKLFLCRHEKWLNETVVFVFHEFRKEQGKDRPSKDFWEVADQSKRQKILPLTENYTSEELSFAASTSSRQSGKRDAASMVQVITSEPSTTTSNMGKLLSPSIVTAPIKYTPEEALTLYVDGRYTKRSYLLMRAGAKKRNADIYPPYGILKKAKEDCCPDKTSIICSEIMAEVNL
ncbi:uncharacterized protein LOC144478082 isoform X1 [Augochlora pura]